MCICTWNTLLMLIDMSHRGIMLTNNNNNNDNNDVNLLIDTNKQIIAAWLHC